MRKHAVQVPPARAHTISAFLSGGPGQSRYVTIRVAHSPRGHTGEARKRPYVGTARPWRRVQPRPPLSQTVATRRRRHGQATTLRASSQGVGELKFQRRSHPVKWRKCDGWALRLHKGCHFVQFLSPRTCRQARRAQLTRRFTGCAACVSGRQVGSADPK